MNTAIATTIAPTLRKPDLVTDRPTTPAPIYHQMPAEMQARKQWVCWRFEYVNNKWTKVPHNPHTGGNASTKAPRTWGSFQEAKAAYLARADFFDGIGYVFRKDDPFVGVDLDHCRDVKTGAISSWAQGYIDRFATYAEISPSQSGVKMIVRATFPGSKGIKKPAGEMYAWGRFFTITGAVLAGHTTISDNQVATDALYADLCGMAGGKPGRAPRDGAAGDGDRAALAALHDADFIEGRRLQLAKRDLILKRFLLATKREETQGFFAARLLWAELHQRWSFIGLYRADGALDDSQTRATMARTIYGRGFSFAEYTVIMSYHFAAQVQAKWGTKQAWREELAALWHNAADNTAYTPRTPTPKRDVAKKHKPVGRSSNHADQVERVYNLLVEQKIGDKAIVKTADLAAAAGMHRVTASSILAELRDDKRITTQRLGQYGGLVVSFSDVAIVADQPTVTPSAATLLEETKDNPCVPSQTAPAGYSSKPQLRDLAAAYIDTPAKQIVNVNTRTGAINARHTAYHFAAFVGERFGYPKADAIAAYKAEQAYRADLVRQEWQRFYARLRAMSRDELVEYITGRCHAEISALCKEQSAFDAHLYRVRLAKAKEQMQRNGWAMPAKLTTIKPVTPQRRPTPPPQARAPIVNQQDLFSIPTTTTTAPAGAGVPLASVLIDRLKRRQAGSEARL